MNSSKIQILSPGMFTTVQDLGRKGYQSSGVPVSGAMDSYSLRIANKLVGNDQGSAGLEITVIGPKIKFLSEQLISITGADLSPCIDGSPVPCWEALRIASGSELTFGEMINGMRSYIAFAGGIDVPLVMGSRSTYISGQFGGLEGRQLKENDVISIIDNLEDTDVFHMPDGFTPRAYGSDHSVRVVLGPQRDEFDDEAIDMLLNSTFTISIDADRVGYRLEGVSISHKSGPDILSQGNTLGAIQVSGDGIPTILMADRGTAGGYAKIATVISADIPILAQALPGDEVRLVAVEIEDAVKALHNQESSIDLIDLSGPIAKTKLPIKVKVGEQILDIKDVNGHAIMGSIIPVKKFYSASAKTKDDTQSFNVELFTENSHDE